MMLIGLKELLSLKKNQNERCCHCDNHGHLKGDLTVALNCNLQWWIMIPPQVLLLSQIVLAVLGVVV